MKNKKLAISVLSTAVLASMASTAFAKVDEGIYIGGNVKEYYSTLTFVDLPQTVRAGVLQKINNAGNNNVVYVNSEGKAASVSNIIEAGNLGDALRDPDENTFAEGDYAIIGSDGQPTGETKNPGSEIDPGEPGELVVESVSAINATTVELELNQSITAEDGYTFTFNGNALAAANVAYGDKKVTLTVAQMADDAENTLVVADKDGNQVYSGTVIFDLNQPTTLTTDAPAKTNAVVGEQVSITFTLKDEDGDAIEGQQVRVRATSGSTVNEEQTLTTDAQGKVTFTYTSIDGRIDTVEAVVLSKPTLRTSVSVEWVETAAAIQVTNPTKNGFIVNTVTNVAADTQTIKYVATFKDANGNPLPQGTNVYVHLDGFTGTFNGVNDNEFTAVPGQTELYVATLAGTDGTAVLEFTTNTAQTISPTFYQDADQAGITTLSDFTSQDARFAAKSVEVVDGTTQEPTFTLALKEGDNVNEDVKAVDGGYEVDQGSTIEFTLTAVDQFGNPFVGVAELSHKVLLDNIAGNDGTIGGITFETAEEDTAYTPNQNDIDFATVDLDGDGIVNVQLENAGGSAGDATNLVVWFDADGDTNLDSDEVKIESPNVKFVTPVTPVVASMDIEADATSVIADGTTAVTYTVDLKDAAGQAYDAQANNQNVIIKLYQNGQLVNQTAGGVAVTAATGGTLVAGQDARVTGVNSNNGQFTFEVTPAATDAGSSIYPVVYIDINNNGTVEEDETVSVQGPAFTSIAEPDHYGFTLDKTDVTAGETVTLTVTAYDNSNAVETDFDGSQVIEVLLAADTGASAATDKSYLRTANFVDGVATISVPVTIVANDDIKITLGVGTIPDADFDGDATASNNNDDNDLTITPAEASKLAVNVANELITVDQYGNAADYDLATGIATVTVEGGTFSGTLNAENQMQLQVVNGALQDASGNALTFTGSAGDKLTIVLSNGKTFEITL